jgi:Flp pilus assembly protein TadD
LAAGCGDAREETAMRARWLLAAPLLLALSSALAAQQWFSVQTDHLLSYSDGNDRGAREAAMRGEELIAVFQEIFHRKDISFGTPLRVLVVHAPPAVDGRALTLPALARTPMGSYMTVDLSRPEPWTEAARTLATLTLEDNYPRAQPWFDHGIASYLAGVRFDGEQMELGGLPAGLALPQNAEWIPLGKLLETGDPAALSSAQRKAFEAESWAVIRWLIDSSRLAQAGAYLNAVQLGGATPEKALREAFSMGSAEVEHEVRASLEKPATRKMPAPRIESKLFQSKKVSAADAHVLLADLSLFGTEGDRTLGELVKFMRENQQNAAVHRSLAWAFLLRHDLENAVEHIRRALELEDSDPAMHYLYAVWANQGDEKTIHFDSAEVRMGTELKAALRRDANYTAALELLGIAQLSDGAVKAALTSLQRASALRPRNSRYFLNLARGYEAEGKLEAARNLMLYSGAGGDAEVSAEATALLNDLGKPKKKARPWEPAAAPPDAVAKAGKYDNLQDAIAEDEAKEARSRNHETAPDRRATEHLKGRILEVACDSGGSAILSVSSAGRTWKISVADRNSAVMIGVDHFDCGWRGANVSINYKSSGKLQGDLVSLERID